MFWAMAAKCLVVQIVRSSVPHGLFIFFSNLEALVFLNKWFLKLFWETASCLAVSLIICANTVSNVPFLHAASEPCQHNTAEHM